MPAKHCSAHDSSAYDDLRCEVGPREPRRTGLRRGEPGPKPDSQPGGSSRARIPTHMEQVGQGGGEHAEDGEHGEVNGSVRREAASLREVGESVQ